jgi:hypothetical protein
VLRALPHPPAAASYTGTMSSTLSTALAPISLPDVDGREIRLGELWKSQPAVLVFLRHYG